MPKEDYDLLTCDEPPFPMDPVDQELTIVTCGKSTQVPAVWVGGRARGGRGGGGSQMPAVVGAPDELWVASQICKQ